MGMEDSAEYRFTVHNPEQLANVQAALGNLGLPPAVRVSPTIEEGIRLQQLTEVSTELWGTPAYGHTAHNWLQHERTEWRVGVAASKIQVRFGNPPNFTSAIVPMQGQPDYAHVEPIARRYAHAAHMPFPIRLVPVDLPEWP